MKEQKHNLRQSVLEQLKALTTGEVQAKSVALGQRLNVVRELWSAQAVCCFVSFGAEIHTHDLIRHFLAEKRHVSVPSFDPVGQRYICSEVKHFETDLTEGRLGILEPKPQAIRPVRTDIPDVWLVPGVAFDETGNRLGRGMGYYDHLLTGARGLKIALAFDFQLVAEVPATLRDVPMDFVVTETRVVQCKRK